MMNDMEFKINCMKSKIKRNSRFHEHVSIMIKLILKI